MSEKELSLIFCNICKNTYLASEKHEMGHFKSFFEIPSYMNDIDIKDIKYFGENRKVVHVYNNMLKENFVYKIYYGMISEKLLNSLSVLSDLNHLNLCNLLNPIEKSYDNNEIALRFIYYSNSLADFIKDKSKITIEVFSRFFYQVCRGVAFLHENRLIHGNLELESILIEGKEGEEIIKIGALEKATCIEDLKIIEIGNKDYMAPELFEREEEKEKDYEKIDVWNLGVVMYQFWNDNESPVQEK